MSCFVLSIFITGCCSEEKENYLTKNNIKGDVKSIIEESYYATVRFGEIEKEKRLGCKEGNFNNEGNLVEMTIYNSDESVRGNNIYVYDEEGNKVEEIAYNLDGTIKRKYTYEYDEEGNKIEEIFYTSDGTIGYNYSHKYDENGNKVKDISYNSDGSINWKKTYEYEYDREKNWTSKITFKDDVATEIEESKFEYYD